MVELGFRQSSYKMCAFQQYTLLLLIEQNKAATEEGKVKTAHEFPLWFCLNGPYAGIVISGAQSPQRKIIPSSSLYKERIFLGGGNSI